jgi:hypothetical protein
MPPTLREVKEKLYGFNTYSVKGGVFTVRREFFYRSGTTIDKIVGRVQAVFPDAIIVESAEIWKPFRGGASTANSSHWFVKFTFPK